MNKDRIWTLVSRKLSGEATASELAELDEIIQVQANASQYIKTIEAYWKNPTEKDEEFLEATYHLHLNRLKEKGYDLEKEKEASEDLYMEYAETKKPATLFKKIYWAVPLLLCAGLVLFFILNKSKDTRVPIATVKNPQSEVITKSGSRTNIQLPDGTLVWLNGNSKLVYDNLHFGQAQRQVTLSGEAYFDVVKMKDKPFIIHTVAMDIKVLGTAFNVKAYPGEKSTEASLVRGSIEVTLKGHQDKIMMKPNDKLVVQNDAITAVKNNRVSAASPVGSADSHVVMSHLTVSPVNNLIVETAWVNNTLLFDNESFEAVALKMERWYGVTILFKDASLKNAHLTGNFEQENIDQALYALQFTSPFTYTINNNIVTIAKKTR